eukprot:359853-Chlamydomonas_euryale.AAC.6
MRPGSRSVPPRIALLWRWPSCRGGPPVEVAGGCPCCPDLVEIDSQRVLPYPSGTCAHTEGSKEVVGCSICMQSGGKERTC